MALVAYTDPQGVFGRHEENVQRHLAQLRSLHWRPLLPEDGTQPLDTTIRTIPVLDLHLRPEGSERLRQHQIPGLSNVPLVQIFVVETASLDIFRESLRPIGRNWFANNVQVRDDPGFVVVHAVSPQDSPKLARAIWQRLNAEFGEANCVQVNVATPGGAGWTALQHVVAEQLLAAFGRRVRQLQTEIRKLRTTQDMPGWNFGVFFAVHESLASAYVSLGLVDDAFRVYEYLETVVGEQPTEIWAQRPQLASHAGSGIGHELSPLDATTHRQALVDLVLAQRASYFDVFQGLLARKVDLLMRMAAQQDSDSLANSFVGQSIALVVERLPVLQKQLESSVGPARALAWLRRAVNKFFARVTNAHSPRIAGGKADLVLIERDYLQGLCALRGWVIPGVFNDVPLDLKDEIKQSDTAEESNTAEELGVEDEDCPASFEEFEAEFFRLSRTAIQYFASASMHRAVLRLTAQLLLIKFHQNRFEECWEIYTGHPQLLAGHSQPTTTVFEAVLACARALGKHQACIDLSWRVLDLPSAPMPLIKTAVAEIEHADPPTSGERPLANWFTPKLAPYLRGDANGYFLELELQPTRPAHQFLAFDRTVLHAVHTDPVLHTRHEIVFEAAKPGKLYTSWFAEGNLAITGLELWHRKMRFVHPFTDTVVAMRPLTTSFTAEAALARQHSMHKRNIELALSSPVPVRRARVNFQPVDPQLQLLLDQVRGVEKLADFEAATITVPVLVDAEFPLLRVKISIDYDCGTGARKYEFYEQLDFGLAVSVDFQESFRQPPKILTQFLVKPFGPEPIAFSHAELGSSQNYQVSALDSGHYDHEMVAYSNAPVSYVFSITRWPDGADSEARADSGADSGAVTKISDSPHMQFSLRYRRLLWECRHILYERCLASLDDGLNGYKLMLRAVLDRLEPHIDLAEYVLGRKVTFDPTVLRTVVDTVFEHMDPTDAARVSDKLLAASEEPALPADWDFKSLDSTMLLNVPDPDAEVVHYLSLQIDGGTPRGGQYRVGETIAATLRIDSITFQAPEMLQMREFEYELDRLSEGWSYSGRVKGCFTGHTAVRESLSLVPNRSGELFLPNVIVKPLRATDASEGSPSSFSSDLDEQQVVVSEHANNRLLIVPDTNMLAITF